MNKKLGKVMEVFIPKEYKNNELIDIMDCKKIGFKIMFEDEMIEVIEKQDERNSKIMKNDIVVVTRQIISNKEFIDINVVGGDF